MGKLKRKTYKLKNFFKEDIWTLEMEELSRAKARFIKYLKVCLITVKTYTHQKIGPQAVALSFFSVMAVVPFMAIVFAITGGLGLADGLKQQSADYRNCHEFCPEHHRYRSKRMGGTPQCSPVPVDHIPTYGRCGDCIQQRMDGP